MKSVTDIVLVTKQVSSEVKPRTWQGAGGRGTLPSHLLPSRFVSSFLLRTVHAVLG